MRINWLANIGQGQGYSGSSEQTAIALDRRDDIDVSVIGYKVGAAHEKNLTKEGKKLISKEGFIANVGVAHGFPNSFSSLAMNDFKVGYTMFETDVLPAGGSTWTGKFKNAAQAINSQLDLLLVPAAWNIQIFRDNGVTIPIEVVPNGVNVEQFSYMDRPQRKTFTFLMLGTLTLRKNPGAVISAFSWLFKDNPDVKLVLKTQSGTLGHLDLQNMGNIEIIDKLSTLEELQQLYFDADAFVFPSRGEGFGMPPIEAMATGLPTIFTNGSGMTEYANENFNYPVKVSHKTPASRFPKNWGYVGSWHEPDHDDLMRQMLYVYEHQEEAREKGMLASAFIRDNFNYDVVADKTVKAIQKYYTGK